MSKFKEKYYDFVVSDFDGTIFTTSKIVTKTTVDAINSFINRGGTFCVCTGRMTKSILKMLNKFGLTQGFVISYNGAEITEVATGTKVYKNHIDNENAVKVLQYAENNGLTVLVYPNDEVTSQYPVESVLDYFKLSECGGNILNSKVSEYFIKNNLTTGKILFLTGGNDGVSNKILNDLPKIIGNDFNIVRSNPYHIDITKKGVSKGDTIKKLANLLGKSMKKLVCFGDQMNDESMMRVASLALVTENGSQKLKDLCDGVIESCDDDGVRKAIEKYCIWKKLLILLAYANKICYYITCINNILGDYVLYVQYDGVRKGRI